MAQACTDWWEKELDSGRFGLFLFLYATITGYASCKNNAIKKHVAINDTLSYKYLLVEISKCRGRVVRRKIYLSRNNRELGFLRILDGYKQ